MTTVLLPMAVIDAYETANQSAVYRNIWLQKMTYLVQTELDGTRSYEFTSADYGPYSRDLAADVEAAISGGFIENAAVQRPDPFGGSYDINRYSLTEKGEDALYTALESPAELSKRFEYNMADVIRYVGEVSPQAPSHADTMEFLEKMHNRVPNLFSSDTHITGFFHTGTTDKLSYSKHRSQIP